MYKHFALTNNITHTAGEIHAWTDSWELHSIMPVTACLHWPIHIFRARVMRYSLLGFTMPWPHMPPGHHNALATHAARASQGRTLAYNPRIFGFLLHKYTSIFMVR